MKQYNVTGMSCAACSARVEKAVSGVDGVTECSVNLLTNSMSVYGTASDGAIIAAVVAAGYGASLKGADAKDTKPLSDTQTPKLLKRLITSLVLLIPLMYLSMGHVMWGFPLPELLHSNPLAIGILQLVICLAVMVINRSFFISGTRGLLHGAPNMDTLVSLGSAASFIYSVFTLISMAASSTPHEKLHDLYFESAAMILALITLGKMLEARSKGKTTNALKSLMDLTPKTVAVLRDGNEVNIPTEELCVGDIFVVRPGESIATDGIIIEGHGAIDESALTGESLPIDKSVGDTVSGATINRSGFIKCRATRTGEDTTLSQIIKMVSDAAATKAPIAKIADKVSGIFVPIVIGIATVVLFVWLAVTSDVGFSLSRAISVLVISCPCALGLATPVAIMVGSGKGAKNGILFKTATSLEVTGKIEIIALDKTGTITKGEPEVTDVIGSERLLSIAHSLESKSEHPIARAIVKKAQDEGISPLETTDFGVIPGSGLTAKLGGTHISGGNADFITQYASIPSEFTERAAALSKSGKTVTFFSEGDRLLGMIAVSDMIKPDSKKAIAELKNMGIRTVMLTGDNGATASAVADEVGIDEVISGVKPDGKEAAIRKLQAHGRVAMVGDGINDAPSLTRADIGIAIGAGTDVAIDAADVVLVNSTLSDVCHAIRLSRATLRTIHQNLFWAFIYNAVCIPIAAGAFVWAGLILSPMLGAAAMSLSSFCVVSNALRLNLVDIHSAKNDKKIKQRSQKERKTMKKTIKIEGMMCPHCEARVKKILEETAGVTEAIVSHKEGTAIVSLSAPIADAALTKLITDNGYKVTDIS